MDENYPIDIHYNKFLDWLVDRRHCDSKWHVQLKTIRSKVTTAISNLPDDLKVSTDLNYFDCVEVLEKLKVEDGENKTLFGQYTAPRVKEWADIVKAYEQEGVYLGESAQLLARMVKYEVPALKHQIQRCQQIIRDSMRREEELTASAAALKEKFEASCREMGIKGINVSVELGQLVNELPVVFADVLEVLPKTLPAITFYQTFLHSIGRRINEDQFLPMLSYILKNGNVTVYQWRYGKAPVVEQRQENRNVTEEEVGIDWGYSVGVVSREDDGIDFGGIDFGDLTLEGGEGEVDLSCISLEESGDGGVAIQEEGVVLKDVGTTGESGDGGVAVQEEGAVLKDTGTTGESVTDNSQEKDYNEGDLQLLLENSSTRNQFLDDLLELKEFLSHRLHELTSGNTAIGIMQMSLDDIGMESSSDGVSDMLGHVTKVLDHMTNKRVQHLFLIKGSQRYQQRLSEKVMQELRLSNRAASQALEAAAKREQATASLNNLQPQHTHLVTRTKKLQSQMAGEISCRYKNRTVNIMGEINQI